jgi:TonB family protein
MTNRISMQETDASSLSSTDARAKFAISLVAGMLSVALLGFGARKLLHLDAPSATDAKPAPTASTEAPRLLDLVVQSTVPEAAMVLRGNTHPLPYNAEVPNSDTPELIEVTAPGHEGRRFWIKLDRPRSLMVTLPTGSGAVDATYEETGAALGDAVVKPSDMQGGVAMNTPRSTGGPAPRWGAAAKPAAANTPDPKTTAPVAAPVVTAAPPVATTVAVAPPPVVVAPPPVAAAPQIPPGTVDPKGVRATVKAHSAQVSACYERARMEKPDLAGRVVVGANIGPGGEVNSASVTSSTAQNARFETCLLGAFRSWTFPAPAGGVPGNVAYTFVFD